MLSGLMLGALLAATSPALPPTPRFRHYGVADGLPSSRIYITREDHDGYIWVGTGDGLARFDGRNFKVWRHRADDPESLASNDVSALLVAHDGAIWAGGEGGGLNRLDAATGGFRHWRHGSDAASLAGDDVTSVAEDPDGTIWVGMYAAGVDHLKPDGSGFRHLRHRKGDATSLVSDNVFTLFVDRGGRLWIGTDSGLDVRDRDGRLRHIRFAGEDKPLYVWQIGADDDGVRVATGDGLFRVRDGVATRWPAGSPGGSVFASLREPNGDVWAAARGELRLYSGDGRANRFKPQPLVSGGFHGRLPFGLMRDHEGGVWVATLDAGLAYLSPGWRAFSHFGHVPEDPASLTAGSVTALARDANGDLLVGGQGHLDRFNPESGQVSHLADAAKLGNASVLALAAADGKLWIGTQHGLRVLANGKVSEVADPRLRSGTRHLVVMDDGSVLAATASDGVLRIDPESLAATAVAGPKPASGADETHQLLRASGRVWRGTSTALLRLSGDGKSFDAVAGVAAGWVRALALHGDDLWLARIDGLDHYRLVGARATLVKHIDHGAGWPAIDVTQMFAAADGSVWMMTHAGLWGFDPASGKFRRYAVDGGAPGPEFSGALVTLANGVVYAGTLHGVIGFQSAATFAPPPAPRLILSALSARRDGKKIPLVASADALKLRWDDHDFAVSAHALSYVDPADVRYRFRMQGFDDGWVETGRNGTREFPGLGAGNYVLDIGAANADGEWSALPPLKVTVATPPWRRPWAWALYALAVALIAIGLWQLARRRVARRVQLGLLEHKRELAEQASAAKTRFLATLGHEIRTPMTGVLGMAELLTHTALDDRQRGMVGTIERSGSVLLKLVNDALDMARIEAGKFELESAPFDPAKLLDEVVALQSGVARGKGLDLRAAVADGVPRRVAGDPIRVRQILLNLINNAVKFTSKGEIKVTLAMDAGALCYAVIDQGPGMTRAECERLFQRFEQGEAGARSGGSGLGLAICRELAGLMGGRVEVESTPGVGSTFRVWLPLPEVAATAVVEAAPAVAARGRRVLVVEDDATVAAVVVGLLEAQGHHVRHVGDALAALAEFELDRCDVVLVDLDLPGVDGFDLIGMLRARPGGDDVAVIVVTARTAADDEAKARAAGADGFVRKPVGGRALASALDRAEQLRSRAGA